MMILQASNYCDGNKKGNKIANFPFSIVPRCKGARITNNRRN